MQAFLFIYLKINVIYFAFKIIYLIVFAKFVNFFSIVFIIIQDYAQIIFKYFMGYILKFIAIRQHRSECQNPISFAQGTILKLGEYYCDDEMEYWYFCTLDGDKGGWVPEQLIERIDENYGRALEDYTAKELEVNSGDKLKMTKIMNGRAWCVRKSDGDEGWVPEQFLMLAQS